MVVFESEEAAEAVKEKLPATVTDAVEIESVELDEVIANA